MDVKPQEEISVSSRYRRFLFTGIGRTLITRIVSLGYIIIVADYFPLDLLDKMVILSSGEILTIQVAVFGIGYSMTREVIYEDLGAERTFIISRTTSIMGLPVLWIVLSFLGGFVGLNVIQILLFLVAGTSQFFMLIGYFVSDAHIQTDKGVLSRAVFSIFNSILVPALFFLIGNIDGVLIAWILALWIAIYSNRQFILPIFSKFAFDIRQTYQIIKFGFPIYLVTIFQLGVQRVDVFFLYLFFQKGDTSTYFYVLKLGQIAEELFANIFVGVLPVLLKIYQRGDIDYYKKISNQFIRISFFAAVVYFGAFIYETKLAILLILDTKFIEGLLWLKIASLGYIFHIFYRSIYPLYAAEGSRRKMISGQFYSTVIWLIMIVAFSFLGPLGLAISFSLFRLTISLYYIVLRREYLDSFSTYFRYLLFALVWLSISWFFPTGEGYTNMLTNSLIMLSIFLGLLLTIRPISTSDWEGITKLLDAKITKRLSPIGKLMTH